MSRLLEPLQPWDGLFSVKDGDESRGTICTNKTIYNRIQQMSDSINLGLKLCEMRTTFIYTANNIQVYRETYNRECIGHE